MYEFITLDRRDGIATLTLNRPAILNAWHGTMREEVRAALEWCNASPEIRAIILTGAGERGFCAGQDLAETKQFKGGDDGANWLQSWFTFYDAIRRLEKPLIAALNGLAAGSGFQVALLADIRIGHPGVTMGQPEIDAGIPSTTGPWLMNERLGIAKTIELTLSGRLMPAQECVECGLINHLVPQGEVMAKAREIAALLAAKPPIAMRLNKQRFREMTEAGFLDAIAAGRRIQREAYESGEPQAWMEAFFAKRTRRNTPRES